jgi:glycosyltransferase involved in cell wall biosynthesis
VRSPFCRAVTEYSEPPDESRRLLGSTQCLPKGFDLCQGKTGMSRNIVILVPAYRCEATILETLEAIQKQGLAALAHVQSVIVAEDGSRDRTADRARAAWQGAVPLQILERRLNCGEYASVNNAVEQFAPEIEWFLIMHADNIPKAGWLELFLDRKGHG